MTESRQAFAASVIIPCRDSVRTLGLQLEALASQVDAPPFEVIVSDNGSSDGLEGFLDSWRQRLELRYVDASALPGAGFARNVGMSVAAADNFLFCDSDDVVARDWVARGCAALETVEVFSGPGWRLPDEHVGDDLEDAWRRLDSAIAPSSTVLPRGAVTWPILLGGNSGLRRSTAYAVGGYDASLRGEIEDNDLAIRLQRGGFGIASAPGVRILYRVRKGAEAAFRESRARAVAQVQLASRYSMHDRSPLLREGRWRWEPPRVVASAVRMLLRPATRDVEGLASRCGLAVGTYEGWFRYRRTGGTQPTAVGAGLDAAPGWLQHPTLILSPHLDDALFSAAELIRLGNPTVWTVFAGEPDDPVTTDWDRSCGFADSHEALMVRRQEDSDAFAQTAARIRHLPCLDGAYTTPERRAQDVELLVRDVASWVEEHFAEGPVVVLPAGAGVPVSSGVLREPGTTQRALAERASRSVLAPLVDVARQWKHRRYRRRRSNAGERGLAINEDHRAVRDAVGDALANDDRVTLVLMEDLPYLWWHPGDDAAVEAAARWGRPASLTVLMVDRVWKQERIHHYRSQLDVMDAAERRLERATTLPVWERLWLFAPVRRPGGPA